MRAIARHTLLALCCAGALQVAAQSVNGPWQQVLNNTPGEREWLFTGQGKQLNMWYIAQYDEAHRIRLCHGKNVPLSLNVRDAKLAVRYATGIDTLYHTRPYKGSMREAEFRVEPAAWENLLNKQVQSVTLVDGHGTLVRELTKAEADAVREVCTKLDQGMPGE